MATQTDADRLYWRRERIARGWHAGNNGAGKRMWFVTRETWGGLEWLESGGGQLVRFSSYETAQRRADALNAAEVAA